MSRVSLSLYPTLNCKIPSSSSSTFFFPPCEKEKKVDWITIWFLPALKPEQGWHVQHVHNWAAWSDRRHQYDYLQPFPISLNDQSTVLQKNPTRRLEKQGESGDQDNGLFLFLSLSPSHKTSKKPSHLWRAIITGPQATEISLLSSSLSYLSCNEKWQECPLLCLGVQTDGTASGWLSSSVCGGSRGDEVKSF